MIRIYYPLIVLILAISSCATSVQEEPKAEIAPPTEKERYVEIYDNGQIKIEGWNLNGKREGLWMAFYENGVRWSECEYRAGKKEGKNVTYYPNGLMRYRGVFVEDKEAGTWQYYKEDGTLDYEKDFNK